jgi:2-dehydro-3-deoxyphosphogluconate aldolase / (4S)-4-hydroxy-2-oxoglutarate aldolase
MIDGLKKVRILDKIYREVVFGIVRTHSAGTARSASAALIEAGLEMQEISMTSPGALEVIRSLSEEYPDSIIGAGTVLDAATARLVIDAGADFIVAPNLNIEVIRMGNRYGIPVMPGIGTVTELITAMEAGADVVKAFPGSVLKPAFIKSLKGPVPQARAIPVGGVAADNLVEWLEAGAYALGLGAGLTHPGGSCEDAGRIKENAARILEIVEDERKRRASNG